MRWLLVASVVIEVTHNLGSTVHTAVTGDSVALPGGIVRTILMGSLGYLAIVRSARWAQWTFAGIQYVTAAVCLAFALFTIPGAQFRFEAVPFGLFLGYLLLGVAASVPGSSRPAPVKSSADDRTPSAVVE